jgi:host factor-I protein
MTKSGINLQDSFLNQVRKDNAPIELILLDGARLNGQVRGFDNFTVILQTGSDQHLIYKHAIAQIVHQRGSYPNPRPYDNSRNARPSKPPRPTDPKPEDKFNTLDLTDVKIE